MSGCHVRGSKCEDTGGTERDDIDTMIYLGARNVVLKMLK
jgi:hypothetical protein